MPNKTKDVRRVVIEALKSPKFKYRTVEGLAKETHLSALEIVRVLEVDRAVRKSLAKSKTGADLYTAKKKVSAMADVWNAFTAINSAKYGN